VRSIEAFLSALRKQSFFKNENTKGRVLWCIAFHQKRAPGRRPAFRASGFILLFLIISLPFITQVSAQAWQPQVASGLAWVIALVAAANPFFNFAPHCWVPPFPSFRAVRDRRPPAPGVERPRRRQRM